MNPETSSRLTCLVLFLALGLGLLGGPHPCQARLSAPEPAAAPAPEVSMAASACHAHAAATPAHPAASAVPTSTDGDRDCCGEHGDCAYACQLQAGVVQAGAPRFAEQAAFHIVAPSQGLDLPLFASVIDHIPLA